MKTFLIVAIFVGCVIGGAIVATIATLTAWNIQIEPRAFQCNDSMWPFSDFCVDMDTHAAAGDTVSPGWTWEKLKVVRMYYILAFYLLWAATAIIPFLLILRMLRLRTGVAVGS